MAAPTSTLSRPTPESRSTSLVGPSLALIWLLAFGAFFFSFALPNNPTFHRLDLWRELPELLLANVFTPRDAPASSWANLSQRIDLLLVAAFIWLGAWGAGHLSLRALRLPLASRSLERTVFALGVGISAVSLITLGFGLLGWLSPIGLGGVLVVAVIGELGCRWSLDRQVEPEKSVSKCDDRSTHNPRAIALGSPSSAGHAWPKQVSWRGVLFHGEQIPYELVWRTLGGFAVGCFLMAMLLGSMLPPTDFDVKAYHLTGPKEFFLNDRITFLEHNVYTNFPFLTEMLCLLGMVLRGDWFRGALTGQIVLMGFAPLTALGLLVMGRRWFGPPVGELAALLHLTTPWTYRISIIAYTEGGLSCYLLLTLLAVLFAIEQLHFPGSSEAVTDLRRLARRASEGLECPVDVVPRWRVGLVWPPHLMLFVLAGLLAGSAMACKYPGLVSVVLPMAAASVLATWRRMSTEYSGPSTQDTGLSAEDAPSQFKLTSRVALAFALGTALTIGPWLLKNLVETGNPVYPLAYGVFGGRDWDAASHAKWRRGHSPDDYDPYDLLVKFIDVTAKSDWQSPLLFGLAVLAWLHRSKTRPGNEEISEFGIRNSELVRWLWLYVSYLFLSWWVLTHRIDRFWVPLIPVASLLAAIGCVWSSHRLWRVGCGVAIGAVVTYHLGFVTSSLCGFNGYLMDLGQAAEFSEGKASPVYFLNQWHSARRLPPDAAVLFVGEALVFDARPRVIYNTVFDQPLFRDWLAERPTDGRPDRDWPYRSLDKIRQSFAEHGVTHILVNWQEVLRYRTSYGYSDFVTPDRFTWLHENGLIGHPLPVPEGHDLREYNRLDKITQPDFDTWGQSLKRRIKDQSGQEQTAYIGWQLFPVRR